MKTTKTFLVSFLIFFAFLAKAQDSIVVPVQTDKVSLGLGMGMDFGGFGGNLLFYPQKNIGLFAGVGYALAGVGYNFGAKIRFISEKKFTRANFFLTGMYGYNAAIKVSGAAEYNKLFNGPTFGLGVDFRGGPASRQYWSIALLIPVRSSEVDTYMDDLKNNHNVEFKNELLPVAISIGYRFVLN